jgi:integrase
MRAILLALQNDPQAQIAMLLSFLGLRTAEMRGLRWEDIRDGEIHVQRSAWRATVAPGKTHRARRAVPFCVGAKSLLKAYNVSQGRPREGYVLQSGLGTPLDVHALALRIIRPALEKHGLPWYGFYAGRRGASTELAHLAKGDTQITAPLFGHTPEIADSFYVKGVPEATRAAALKYDELLALPAKTEE